MHSKEISLVIPALNEEGVIEENVRSFVSTANRYFEDYEVILIDDGSKDSTGTIMDMIAAEDPERIRAFHNSPNKGLGWSYRFGVGVASKEYVMLLCGDGGLPASSLPPIFAEVGKADIVIPFMSNMDDVKSGCRQRLSSAYTLLLNGLFGQKLRYYNGLQVHRAELLRHVDKQSVGFAFQGEILVQLLRAGASYVQVQTQAAEQTQKSSAIKLKNFSDAGKSLLRLLAFSYLPNKRLPTLKRIVKENRFNPSAESVSHAAALNATAELANAATADLPERSSR